MQKFCYKCGALEEEKGPLIKGLCQECFAAEHPLIMVSEEMELEICGRCGAYFLNSRWHDLKEEKEPILLKPAEEAVRSRVRVAQMTPAGLKHINLDDADKVDVELKSEPIPPNVRVEIEARGKVHKFQKTPQTTRKTIEVKIKTTTCDACARKSAGYYEAMLQVRGEETLSKEILADVFRTLEGKALEEQSKNRDEFVSKIEKKHGGLDLYTSSASLARSLAEVLKTKYSAKVDESAKLIGQTRDGRNKYRVSVVARLPK